MNTDTTLPPPRMPRATSQTKPVTPETLTVSDQATRIKLYIPDHATAQEVLQVAQQLNRTLTLHEVMREALHVGLPVVLRKYQAALEAIATTK